LLEKSLIEILSIVEKGGRVGHSSQSSRPDVVDVSRSFIENRTYERKSRQNSNFFQMGFQRTDVREEVLPQAFKYIGDVKRASFIDRVAMQWYCGGICIPPTSDTFHSNNRVMLVCDGGIIFYDFSMGLSHAITPLDFSKVTISSAEFVFIDLCAVGCADGAIR
jgi:hypothetical protein